MVKIKLILILSIILFFSACQQKTVKKDFANDKNKWKSLIEKTYKIKYPDDWELKKPGIMGTEFMIFSPLKNNVDTFRENVNLVIQNLKGYKITLQQFTKSSESQLKKMMDNIKFIKSVEEFKNGRKIQKVIFTSKQDTYNLKFEQYYFIENNSAYVLTLTCEIDQFDNYKAIGEKILDSFKILKH